MAGGVVEKPVDHGSDHHDDGHGTGKNYLNHDKSIMSWIVTLDHKRIGMMYLVAVTFALLLGGVFALVLRTELLEPKGDFLMTNDFYNRMFTLHGAVMVFLFIIPGIPAALGNFMLPLQLGAKDLALPRLNLLSLYLYAFGLLFFVGVLVFGGIETGWTLYPPYSFDRETSIPIVLALTGVFILGFSSILTGLNFIATIHKLRPPSMTVYKMPLFLWALYATSIIQILATPILGITVGLAAMEHIFKIGIFLPEYGGDPVMFQHFFWFYSHPAVYIMVVPAMGVQSEIISCFARKPIFGYKAIAWSSIAIAVVGFLVWGHHMFVSGQSPEAGIIFSFLTFAVAIPSAIKTFNWVATLYKGQIELKAPMIYALAFIYLFGIGGLTGLFLGSITTNVHLHDTYFIIAHFHMVMVGTVLSGFLGGLHYWWPKMTGKMYNEMAAKIAAAMVFIGFNVAFLPQFVAGTRGMPRRYANYDEQFTIFHQISTVGAFILGAGVGIVLVNMIVSLVKGKKAPRNPWGGASLEWQADSPPDHHNFTRPIQVIGPYEFDALERDETDGGYKVKEDRGVRVDV